MKTTARARILVVDDDVLLSRALQRMLTPHAVTLANSGDDALEKLADADYDVILCDIMMPGLSGPEFYHRLRDVRPELCARVLFMTGGALERIQPMMADIPNRVLEKPFTRAELKRIIEEFLTAVDETRGPNNE